MRFYILFIIVVFLIGCSKPKDDKQQVVPPIERPMVKAIFINNSALSQPLPNINTLPDIKINFSAPIKEQTLATAISVTDAAGAKVNLKPTLSADEKTVGLQPVEPLSYLKKYNLTIGTTLQSKNGAFLETSVSQSFATSIDSSRKFTSISDELLLTKVQQQTFKYFWDFAHPVSGLIREGSQHSPDIVTIGGSGFGLMAILVGIERGFISKIEGLQRVQKMTTFLKEKVPTFHGAYPHWVNGATGAVIPFSSDDNGADLVETSFLVQGLIAVREYFSGNGDEFFLRNDINTIINKIEWSWFQQNNQNVLYWHWSADKAWVMNLKIQGWNECLVTYLLAAGSKNHPIKKQVYDAGWAKNGAIKNGKQFYGQTLPLGQDYGGPLFFSQYSFLGLNPNKLSDAYAAYFDQNKAHTLINYEYCKTNPKGFYGYSDSVWGLTASTIKNGYTASSPSNDMGFIAPTAALSSFPYTPAQSMAALRFYYYVLGDKLWKEYGFADAFSLDVLKMMDFGLAMHTLLLIRGQL